jgi:hypothetical protein
MSTTRENTVSIASLIQMSTGPRPLLEPRGGGEQSVGVGDVGRRGRRLGAEGLELALDLVKGRFVAGDEADAVAGAGEAPSDCPSDSGGRSGDDDDAGACAHDSTGKAMVDRSAT